MLYMWCLHCSCQKLSDDGLLSHMPCMRLLYLESKQKQALTPRGVPRQQCRDLVGCLARTCWPSLPFKPQQVNTLTDIRKLAAGADMPEKLRGVVLNCLAEEANLAGTYASCEWATKPQSSVEKFSLPVHYTA